VSASGLAGESYEPQEQELTERQNATHSMRRYGEKKLWLTGLCCNGDDNGVVPDMARNGLTKREAGRGWYSMVLKSHSSSLSVLNPATTD
jgi:hypothetical protein